MSSLPREVTNVVDEGDDVNEELGLDPDLPEDFDPDSLGDNPSDEEDVK